jgi:F-type H+-transporting ATPase subunit delta
MWSRTATTLVRRNAARSVATEAFASAKVKLNFCLPHETIYKGASVYSVIIPGVEGEYGVTANHVPYVAQLKPGVLQILHEENSSDVEKYFVAGGYALTHPDSTTVRV